MKKTISIAIIVFIGFIIWYLFIKPYDYTVRFKVKTSPGAVFKGVEEWNFFNQQIDSFSYKINNKEAYMHLNETINIKEFTLDINWDFKSISDSTTFVTVGITEKEKSFYNKITVPFLNTPFEEIAVKIIKDYKIGLESQLEQKFKVKYIGIDTLKEKSYAYIELKNIEMFKKAEQMMKFNAKLMMFINEHKIKGGNHPFLIVDNWNLNTNNIDFRFCFPIKMKDSMPFHQDIKFGVLQPKKVLKAVYNGNYITSDRGWFALHEYAKRHNIDVENKPIEIFYDNPFYGGDELKWKAEVFLPIK